VAVGVFQCPWHHLSNRQQGLDTSGNWRLEIELFTRPAVPLHPFEAAVHNCAFQQREVPSSNDIMNG